VDGEVGEPGSGELGGGNALGVGPDGCIDPDSEALSSVAPLALVDGADSGRAEAGAFVSEPVAGIGELGGGSESGSGEGAGVDP
jgi:hypothetical protein